MTSRPAATDRIQPDRIDDVDLLVVGGGMAGLTAAAVAATEGARVVLVEKGEHLGGSAIYAGFAWTAPSVDVLREINPDGDPELGRTLVGGFAEGVDWIRSLGVDCRPAVPVLRYGRGHQFDTQHYLTRCEQRIRQHGGLIWTRTRAESLRMDGAAVTGATVRRPDGGLSRIQARWTLLASGGYQADPQLRAALIHPQAAGLQLRGNPGSEGDGLRLGRSAGAVFGTDGAGFYGHLIPAGVPLRDPSQYVDLALYFSEHALLFNRTGERFVDETLGDHLSTIALVAQPQARGLLVADARTHRDWITQSYVDGGPAVDKFALASRLGARCAVAHSLDELDDMPAEWGYPGAKIRAAIERLNSTPDEPDRTSPGRRHDRPPLTEPPYYLLEAAPAITFTLGGLLIDPAARVRSAAGGRVPGLLAAGADAGGLYHQAYAGGLAAALVFGRAAARTATGAPAPSDSGVGVAGGTAVTRRSCRR
ncbi:MAG TPA: FAD-dependent oxidoreductase [Mycobacteriales bacterium]|nr:FAD-dependent oxidoreductase [Mycobacteriales bacterium]